MMWSPRKERILKSKIFEFQKHIENKFKLTFSDYKALHQWSVQKNTDFWKELFPFFNIQYSGSLDEVLEDQGFESYTWFKNVKLNFAQNLLAKGKEDKVALNFQHESGMKRTHTYGELRKEVASFAHFLTQEGFQKGDVLACYMPNVSETVISMLSATSLGGVFTSTSSDFGVPGVLDRFLEVKPKILVAAIGYEYGGKYFDQTEKIKEIEKELKGLTKLVIVDFLNKGVDLSVFQNAISFHELLNTNVPLQFMDVAFSDPLYVMYSSGTTGKPKCIVHSTGGVLLQHVKELGLHTDLNADKKICYFTTCGWMMWNWLISSLFFGCEVVLYEGSPAFPSPQHFFNIINREKINIFGTSPKFLKALEDTAAKFEKGFDSLETILSTGSPLLPEQYDYVYKNIKEDLMLASISGGTDILGCFMLGNPTLPVFRGEIQCLGLGMDVKTLDDELVCGRTFPTRPIYFLNDSQNEKIKAAYFNQNPGFWTHGDFIKINERGGVVVYGRSDATLNPGGVRIGTSEIYQQTELIPFIQDSLCVGRPVAGDVEVVLFVKMKPNEELTSERKKQIRALIKKNTTPRHVPQDIIQVSDIPYTRSGKKVELAVARLLSNRPVTNLEAIANPECLKDFVKPT